MAMFPPFYATCAANAGVKAIFGTSPRIYPHGQAPASGSVGFATPYAVQQIITGSPSRGSSSATSRSVASHATPAK